MTASVQQKFFAVLCERAEKEGLEVVTAHNYSNVGYLHLQKPGSFATALSVHFDFQPKSAHFVTEVNVFTGRPLATRAGFAPHELDQAIDAIIAAARNGS